MRKGTKIQRGITKGWLYLTIFLIGFTIGKSEWIMLIWTIIIGTFWYIMYERFDKKHGYKSPT